MPTLEATRVKCPECGATTNATGDVLKCEYCGAASRVQRRTQVFDLPKRMPPPAPNYPKPIATQVRTRRWPVVLLVAGPILFPIVLILGIYLHGRAQFLWNGRAMIVTDVDGDGNDDAIGFARYLSGDRMKLRAISGKDGSTIWQTDSLGSYIANYQSYLAWSGRTVIRASTDKNPLISGFDLETGKPLWTAVPSESVERTCHSTTAGKIELYLKDKTMVSVDLATGKLSATTSTACTPMGDHPKPDMSRHAFALPGARIEEVYASRAPIIVKAEKSPGTAIPIVAAFAEDDQLIWKSEIPGHDARQAKRSLVAFDDHYVAALWDWEKDTQDPTLTLFDRATGNRLWEANATYTGHMFVNLEGLVIGNTTIFANVEGSVQGFDVRTGKRKFVVGSTN